MIVCLWCCSCRVVVCVTCLSCYSPPVLARLGRSPPAGTARRSCLWITAIIPSMHTSIHTSNSHLPFTLLLCSQSTCSGVFGTKPAGQGGRALMSVNTPIHTSHSHLSFTPLIHTSHSHLPFTPSIHSPSIHTPLCSQSTCSGVFGTKPAGQGGRALMSVDTLSQLAMERTGSARKAVELMGKMAEQYGCIIYIY